MDNLSTNISVVDKKMDNPGIGIETADADRRADNPNRGIGIIDVDGKVDNPGIGISAGDEGIYNLSTSIGIVDVNKRC